MNNKECTSRTEIHLLISSHFQIHVGLCLCVVVDHWPSHELARVVSKLHGEKQYSEGLANVEWERGDSRGLTVEFGLYNLSLDFSLTHVVVAESSFG